MKKEKISGIYKITSKHNGKIYIGQSQDIYTRWKQHWKEVKSGSNTYLHNTMRKYGKDNFEYEIIEKCGQDVINEREIYWISYYDSFNNGFNLTTGGDGVKNRKFSKEEIEQRREKALNDKMSKPVYQINKDGKILKEWRSYKEISKTLNVSSSNIHDALKHKDGYRFAYGYIWVYKEEYDNGLFNIDLYLNINKNIEKNKIYQIDKNNNLIYIWDDIDDILINNKKYKKSSIYACCNKSRKTIYGYVWEYEYNYDPDCNYSLYFCKESTSKYIYQFDINGNFINKYSSIVEASLITGINKDTIGQCARHVLKTAGGYIWLFSEEKDLISEYLDIKSKKCRKIYCFNNNKIYNTIREAGDELSLDYSSISKVCNNKIKHVKGYVFKYID